MTWTGEWSGKWTFEEPYQEMGFIRVYYRPDREAPEHVTDFIVCTMDPNPVVEFEGFRRWDGCMQLRAATNGTCLHFDDRSYMQEYLQNLTELLWLDELEPGEGPR